MHAYTHISDIHYLSCAAVLCCATRYGNAVRYGTVQMLIQYYMHSRSMYSMYKAQGADRRKEYVVTVCTDRTVEYVHIVRYVRT